MDVSQLRELRNKIQAEYDRKIGAIDTVIGMLEGGDITPAGAEGLLLIKDESRVTTADMLEEIMSSEDGRRVIFTVPVLTNILNQQGANTNRQTVRAALGGLIAMDKVQVVRSGRGRRAGLYTYNVFPTEDDEEGG